MGRYSKTHLQKRKYLGVGIVGITETQVCLCDLDHGYNTKSEKTSQSGRSCPASLLKSGCQYKI